MFPSEVPKTPFPQKFSACFGGMLPESRLTSSYMICNSGGDDGCSFLCGSHTKNAAETKRPSFDTSRYTSQRSFHESLISFVKSQDLRKWDVISSPIFQTIISPSVPELSLEPSLEPSLERPTVT